MLCVHYVQAGRPSVARTHQVAGGDRKGRLGTPVAEMDKVQSNFTSDLSRWSHRFAEDACYERHGGNRCLQ